jgi:hypothetical protein
MTRRGVMVGHRLVFFFFSPRAWTKRPLEAIDFRVVFLKKRLGLGTWHCTDALGLRWMNHVDARLMSRTHGHQCTLCCQLGAPHFPSRVRAYQLNTWHSIIVPNVHSRHRKQVDPITWLVGISLIHEQAEEGFPYSMDSHWTLTRDRGTLDSLNSRSDGMLD